MNARIPPYPHPARVTGLVGEVIEVTHYVAGWVPSHNRAQPGEPKNIDMSAVWLRFRAACARAERTLYGPDDPMWRYLAARAAQADAEASARERSMEATRRPAA